MTWMNGSHLITKMKDLWFRHVSLYHVAENNTSQGVFRGDVVNNEEVGGDKEHADNVAQDDLSVGVAELRNCDVYGEGDGEEDEAGHTETGEQQLEEVLEVCEIVTAIFHNKVRVTF